MCVHVSVGGEGREKKRVSKCVGPECLSMYVHVHVCTYTQTCVCGFVYTCTLCPCIHVCTECATHVQSCNTYNNIIIVTTFEI